jgi:hypothetical protein
MDEMIRRVSEKAGISEDQARQAAQACLGFLKEKLPAPASSMIDEALGSSQGAGVADAAKGMFDR